MEKINQKPCFLKPLTPNTSFILPQEVHCYRATHHAVFCSSERSHQAAWQGRQEAPGIRGFLGRASHDLPLPKTPVGLQSSRLPRSVPRRQSPAALVEQPKSCDFQAVTGMTWTPRASDLCLSCPSSGWPGPGAAGQGKHSSTRNLLAWVQLHFETLTKCFHYIRFVVLLFYLIFKQIFHFSQKRNNLLFPSHQLTANFVFKLTLCGRFWIAATYLLLNTILWMRFSYC